MPASSDNFPWPSYYGHYDFFEQRLQEHAKVIDFKADGEGAYSLNLEDGKNLRTFICECYSFGIAEYTEVMEKLGKVDLIVINSNWCGYTNSAKLQAQEDKVGLFSLRELLGALNF